MTRIANKAVQIDEVNEEITDGIINEITEKKQIEDTRVMLPEEKHIYKPSEFNDLLDFNENPLGFPHVLWLRVLPSIVVLVSASGLIEIRENKKGIAIHSK